MKACPVLQTSTPTLHFWARVGGCYAAVPSFLPSCVRRRRRDVMMTNVGDNDDVCFLSMLPLIYLNGHSGGLLNQLIHPVTCPINPGVSSIPTQPSYLPTNPQSAGQPLHPPTHQPVTSPANPVNHPTSLSALNQQVSQSVSSTHTVNHEHQDPVAALRNAHTVDSVGVPRKLAPFIPHRRVVF